MKRRGSYFKLGLFVLVAVGLGLAALVVLGVGVFFRQPVYMETYLDESVQGLDVGSPVKHRGVQIGVVQQIDFVRNSYDLDPASDEYYELGRYVIVRMSLPRGFGGLAGGGEDTDEILRKMIEDGLRVRLAAQGLTGQAYLEVDYLPPERYPPLEISWKPETTYVPSAASTISRLSSAVDSLVEEVDPAAVARLTRDLDRMMGVFTSSMEEANLPGLSREATLLLRELRRTNEELQQITSNPELQETPERINQTLSSVTTAMERLDNVIASNESQINETVENMRAASQDMREITENAKRYPSLILFGEAPARSSIDR
ncbi:MAG: MCE family protein [Spirochaetales bacterium]|nr:MCE family protein [Leptospiraceae bacterium]MCP5481813.1 MCE family protein [Spirochaetales bacterium]